MLGGKSKLGHVDVLGCDMQRTLISTGRPNCSGSPKPDVPVGLPTSGGRKKTSSLPPLCAPSTMIVDGSGTLRVWGATVSRQAAAIIETAANRSQRRVLPYNTVIIRSSEWVRECTVTREAAGRHRSSPGLSFVGRRRLADSTRYGLTRKPPNAEREAQLPAPTSFENRG